MTEKFIKKKRGSKRRKQCIIKLLKVPIMLNNLPLLVSKQYLNKKYVCVYVGTEDPKRRQTATTTTRAASTKKTRIQEAGVDDRG